MESKLKYVKLRFLIAFTALLYFNSFTVAQVKSTGTPFIRNYSRSDYKAGQQNWMIDQGPDERMYFANNDGFLEFDGVNWTIHRLPNGIIVRSIYVAPDGKIYVGAYNEFGVFEPNPMGKLVYRSFKGMLNPEDRNFDEIWRIHNTPDGLIFQSYHQMVFINNGNIKVIKAPGAFHFSYFVNGQLYAIDLEKGILRYAMGEFFPLPGTGSLTGLEIMAVLPFENKLLFATADDGLFLYDGNQLTKWTNPAAAFLEENQVFSALVLNDDYYAFGTILNGLLICTKNGVPVQKINRLNGIQNNTILCLKTDKSGNLWLGTDNGIDYIEINSPLSVLSYAHGISAGYTARLYDDKLYLGTNQGVFYINWNSFLSLTDNDKFRLVENTWGQVWTLQVIDDALFCGTHNGTFTIRENSARKICDVPGGWIYRKMPGHEDKIIGGTYSGLILIHEKGLNSYTVKKIKGFYESSRVLEIDDDGTIWMSHGFKGVYHLYLNHELDSVVRSDFYNSSHGFSSDIGINVTRLKNKIYFSARDGLYQFNRETESFGRTGLLNDLKNWKNLALLKEDEEGNIWYFADGAAGVLRKLEDGSYTDVNLPFRQITGKFIGGFELVYPVDEQHVLFGASDGFIHYNPQKFKDYQLPLKAFLTKVSLQYPDSVIFSGHLSDSLFFPEFKFRNNNLYFSFSSNQFENPDKKEYATFLEGYDPEWTGWETRNIREFTNLYEGNYTFYVKARNIYGNESPAVSYRFSIQPPFRRTTMAYIIYSVIGLIMIGILVLLIRRKIERSKQKEAISQQERFKELEDKLQREALEAEKEIIRLRNEKLKEQIVLKDKELANSTMATIHKNKLLNKIKSDLKKLSSDTRDKELKDQIHNQIKRINKELDTEKQWEVFETHFENVHEAFLKRLKTQFPELSPRELKLCAYLRMNISSKEIAVLMNISIRGVEISRYRLRKKLNLERNENLTDFILSY